MKKVFYQPTSIDAIDNNSIIVRKSSDRADAVLSFCQNYFKNSLNKKNILDIGCGHGYFMNYFQLNFASVQGINISEKEITAAKIFYPKIASKIVLGDVFTDLYRLDSFDVTLFLNVFHSILASHSEEESIEILQLIDQKTKELMFFEMRQDGEELFIVPEQAGFNSSNGAFRYFSEGWTPESIKEYIFKHTTFTECQELMVDSDSTGFYERNFGRTLFVFYRKEQ